MSSNTPIRRYLRKIYALPSEHGAWIWWIGPFLLGMAAGGAPQGASALLFLAALTAFLSRQPTTLLVKVLSRRRPQRDLRPSLFWMLLYGASALTIAAALFGAGYSRLLWLVVPGIPVFIWQLVLVSRREERSRQAIELVGSGVLALAAPAAYWVAGGMQTRAAAILWGLSWLQSAASIVYVYLRLRQRVLLKSPNRAVRWRMGARTLAYYGFNLGLSIILVVMDWTPTVVSLAYGFIMLEALEGIARPAIGRKPTAIGLRQLAVSSVFYVLMSLAYLL